MPPLCQTNEMHQSDPVIRMMPTPGFVPHNTIHPSREDRVSPAPTTNHSPAPTTNHSPAQPLTSVSCERWEANDSSVWPRVWN
jgi:hypothetical protein